MAVTSLFVALRSPIKKTLEVFISMDRNKAAEFFFLQNKAFPCLLLKRSGAVHFPGFLSEDSQICPTSYSIFVI